MVMVCIYIEGGGDGKDQHARLREAFSKLFERAGFQGRMPQLIAGGGREQTFDSFQTALRGADAQKCPMLLVDSEEPVETQDLAPDSDGAWLHLARRDKWVRPDGMNADQVQLMATCMETWVVADRVALRKTFANCLRENALPARNDLEECSRQDIQQSLEDATRDCGANRMYRKGRRSFQVVGRLDPVTLRERLPHFGRLMESLNRRMPRQ